MAAESDPRTPFDRLIFVNREVFASGNYHAAYHTLAAALHEAQTREDTEGLFAVQQIAEEQLSLIDRMAPQWEHSTPSAEARGQISRFAMLAHQAHAHRQLIETQRRRQGRFPCAHD